jgi:hypothetical protein
MTNAQWDHKKQQLDAALRILTSIGGAPDSTSDARATEAAGPPGTAALVAPPPPDPSRTLMRLVVGTALLGWDELARRAAEWERQAALGARLPEATAAGDAPVASAPARAEAHERTRRALIGWIFATQDRLRAAHDPTRWLQSAASHMFGTAMALVSEALGGRERRAAPTSMTRRWRAGSRWAARRSSAVVRWRAWPSARLWGSHAIVVVPSFARCCAL